LRDRYGELLEQHRQILRAAAARHEGEEVDTQGDAFFFSFHRAQDAVLAAAEAQRTLHSHAWPDGARVKVRMGIHTGEPGRSHARLLAAAALAAVALVAVLAFALTRGSSVTVVANSLAAIDPKSNHIVRDVAVGTRPLGLVATDHGVWVADSGDQSLVHISP